MSPIRNFWAHLLNPCISMSTAEWPFSLLDDRHADVVKLALEKLEILVSMSEDDIADVGTPISHHVEIKRAKYQTVGVQITRVSSVGNHP